MDKNHSFIFIPEHHFTSTLFLVLGVKIRKYNYFTSVQEGKEQVNGKLVENHLPVFSRV